MDRGDLVSDDIMVSIISDRVDEADCANGSILDGFPRTIAQADALETLLATKKLKLDAVIELKVDDKILVDRIETRARETGGARADDNAETLKKRLKVYYDQTAPLIEFYGKRDKLQSVDGMAAIEEVASQIDRVLMQAVDS